MPGFEAKIEQRTIWRVGQIVPANRIPCVAADGDWRPRQYLATCLIHRSWDGTKSHCDFAFNNMSTNRRRVKKHKKGAYDRRTSVTRDTDLPCHRCKVGKSSCMGHDGWDIHTTHHTEVILRKGYVGNGESPQLSPQTSSLKSGQKRIAQSVLAEGISASVSGRS